MFYADWSECQPMEINQRKRAYLSLRNVHELYNIFFWGDIPLWLLVYIYILNFLTSISVFCVFIQSVLSFTEQFSIRTHTEIHSYLYSARPQPLQYFHTRAGSAWWWGQRVWSHPGRRGHGAQILHPQTACCHTTSCLNGLQLWRHFGESMQSMPLVRGEDNLEIQLLHFLSCELLQFEVITWNISIQILCTRLIQQPIIQRYIQLFHSSLGTLQSPQGGPCLEWNLTHHSLSYCEGEDCWMPEFSLEWSSLYPRSRLAINTERKDGDAVCDWGTPTTVCVTLQAT